MSEGSPRSARTKKKSHLAKLAARKRESDDSASEMGSKASLNDALRRHVLTRDMNNSASASDETDEGIGFGSGYSNGTKKRFSASTDSTLDRLKSMKVRGNSMEDSDTDEEAGPSRGHNKRDRDQNSDGDDLRKDSGSSRVKKKSISNDSDEDEATQKGGVRGGVGQLLSDSESETESDTNSNSNTNPNLLTRTFRRDAEQEEMREQYRNILNAPDPSAENNLHRRRSPLTMRKSELDPVEEHETSASEQESPTRTTFERPRPSVASPTPPRQHSGVGSVGGGGADESPGSTSFFLNSRPWSAAVTEMSDKSYVSSSALPLITTKEARNRSFLVGGMGSTGSLLGQDELERFFPDRKMRVFVGTWNMCEMKRAPASLDHFMLPDACDYVCDMYIIATQESTPNRKEWEIKLQETLGPQHVLYHSAAFGVLYTSVFIRRDLIWFCSIPEVDQVGTRKFSPVKTKGGLGISFTIFGTSILLVNCHLHPHDGKMKERISDYKKINSGLNLPREVNANSYAASESDVSAKFDVVFWMGDTNFRLLKPRAHVESAMGGITAAATASDTSDSSLLTDYDDLLQHDELYQARTQGEAFQDFQEGRIKFLPSYKYDIGTNNIDTSSKMRIPSYTDRVLFRCRRKHAVTCVHYDMAFDVTASDHKPVYGVYEATLRPGRDTIPLSAGQFNREVWIEANKRRGQARSAGGSDMKSKAANPNSSVCSIQ